MNREEFYTTPKQEIFDEIKNKSICIWKTKSKAGNYVEGKVKLIETIQNSKENYSYILSLFDIHNREILIYLVNEETRKFLIELFEFAKKGE